jgi:hypothetical protein
LIFLNRSILNKSIGIGHPLLILQKFKKPIF